MKGELRGDLEEWLGVPQQPRGHRGITWEGDNLENAGFYPWSPPHPEYQAQACCRWRPPAPLEGQDQAHGWALSTAQRLGPARGEIISFGMDPPSQPVNHHILVERGLGSPSLRTLLRAPQTSPCRGLFRTFGFAFWLFPN